MIKMGNFVNGQQIYSIDQYTNGFNHSISKVFYKFISSNERDVDLGVDASKKSFLSPSIIPVFERGEINFERSLYTIWWDKNSGIGRGSWIGCNALFYRTKECMY